MNGKDIFKGFRYIDDDIIEEAEFGMFPAKTVHRTIRRPLLVAAIIALTLLLVGCAVVYILSLKEIKLGEQQTAYDSFSYDPVTGLPVEYLGKETVTEQVLSFAGMKDTPAFQAAQEWFDFKQAYDPDLQIQASVWGNEPVFPDEYYGYGLYSQEMKDKLDELLQKYDLKLRGKPVDFRTAKELLQAMGAESILTPNSGGSVEINYQQYYENGNLDIYCLLSFDGDADAEPVEHSFSCLYYRAKDCLIPDMAILGSDTITREWLYTTASGEDVLIIRAPSSYIWVFCDTGNYTTTLRLESKLTDRQVELAADMIDFSLEPELLDNYESIDNDSVGMGEEINGYRIGLKSAFTDGYCAHIILSVTAPEGVALTDPNNHTVGVQSGDGTKGRCEEDGDGLLNTCNVIIRVNRIAEGEQIPFPENATFEVYWEDLYLESYDFDTGESSKTLLTEGVWEFNIPLNNADYREVELVSEPVKTKLVTGWDMQGNDVYGETQMLSFTLRAISACITCDMEDAAPDFLFNDERCLYVVMQDGSKIPLMGDSGTPGVQTLQTDTPIDLDHVNHIILADGTKLIMPER